MSHIICRKEKIGYIIYDPDKRKISIEKELQESIDYRVINPGVSPSNSLISPITVFLELTKRCNLSCKHCFRDYDDGKDLSTEDWIDIIDGLYESGVCSVKITGGEPFIRSDLSIILDYLEQKYINYIIYTNGCFEERYIQWLKNLKYLDLVRVSVDGIPETNDSIRGLGVWDKAITTIKKLEANNIPCELNYTVSRQNYVEIPILSKIIREANISAPIHTGFIKCAGKAKYNDKHCFYDNKSIYEVATIIKGYESQLSNLSKLVLLKPIYYELFGDSYGCPAGRTSMTIKQDGTVIPCGVLPKKDFQCGNILKDGINSVWNSRCMISLNEIPVAEQCKNCIQLYKNCTGGCRGNAYNLCGSLDVEDINCSVYKVFCD